MVIIYFWFRYVFMNRTVMTPIPRPESTSNIIHAVNVIIHVNLKLKKNFESGYFESI